MEPGESLIEAVIRETLEETAWQFRPNALIGIYRWIHPLKNATYLRHCFSGTITQNTGQPLDKEIIETIWLTQEEILQREKELRSPLVSLCIEDYLDGKQYPLTLFNDTVRPALSVE